MLTYTGKVLNYILATPGAARRRRQPAAAGHRQRGVGPRHPRVRPPLRLPRSATATARPRASSSSGATRRCRTVRSAPRTTRVKVLDPETGDGMPAGASSAPTGGRPTSTRRSARSSRPRRRTASRATTRTRKATAARFRDGAYWSGDLAYRDADGWLYFAGRSNEWLRVDGENFAAAPVEAIVARHPDVRSVAVYAVPDDPVGDRVMVALELRRRPGVRPRRRSTPSSPSSPTSDRSGCRRSSASPPSCRSWPA